MGPWQAASPENSSAAEPVAQQQQHPAGALTDDAYVNGHVRAPEVEGPLEGSDSEEDAGIDEFESMMHQLRHGRNHWQDLPDEERRARAAAIAEHLSQALALNHVRDSDSEDSF